MLKGDHIQAAVPVMIPPPDLPPPTHGRHATGASITPVHEGVGGQEEIQEIAEGAELKQHPHPDGGDQAQAETFHDEWEARHAANLK